MLDFSAILENALAMRPDTNIVGGSVRQDFDLDLRLDYTILKASVGDRKNCFLQPVLWIRKYFFRIRGSLILNYRS